MVDILDFRRHIVSVTTAQLSQSSAQLTLDNIEMYGICVPIKLCLQKQAVGWIWPMGLWFDHPWSEMTRGPLTHVVGAAECGG